jgi:metal-dependent amidase/aminoacylase/carboxypeptidase family protein
VFDDVDAALMCHPGDKTMPIRHALASMPLTFEFHGVATHAAGSPAQGRSALAAMIQLFVSVDALRQFLPETSRVHGVILDGGQAANVIPDYTRASFQVRAVTSELLTDHVDRVEACARAAALATGTTVDITRWPRRAPTCSATAPCWTPRGRSSPPPGPTCPPRAGGRRRRGRPRGRGPRTC